MLYVALILISVGLIIVLSALFLSSQKKENQVTPDLNTKTPAGPATGEPQKVNTDGYPSEAGANAIHSDENGYIELKERKLDTGPAKDEVGDIREELRKDGLTADNNRNSKKKSVEFVSSQHLEKVDPGQVVLFEDDSDAVDYEKSTNTIDPSRVQYEKLKRLGRGKLEVVKDGISIFIEKNFYRFDFHKIYKLKTGENYIALFIKGSPSVKLLLFDEFTPLVNDVKKSFENYTHISG